MRKFDKVYRYLSNYCIFQFDFEYYFNDHEKTVRILPDIIESLKWVQREIGNFGGNKNQVTIMGHSSGGSAVSLLTVLPAAQGNNTFLFVFKNNVTSNDV